MVEREREREREREFMKIFHSRYTMIITDWVQDCRIDVDEASSKVAIKVDVVFTFMHQRSRWSVD